jgi:hypothetical protein
MSESQVAHGYSQKKLIIRSPLAKSRLYLSEVWVASLKVSETTLVFGFLNDSNIILIMLGFFA